MSTRVSVRRTLACLVVVAAAWSLVSAEDVEKKFRFGLAVGGSNNSDDIPSDSANVLTLVDDQEQYVATYIDPRDDSGVFGNLDIQAGPIATFSAQYAVSKVFVVEASVGYSKVDVGDVEVQAQFTLVDIPDLERFNFEIFRVPVGKLERVPVQLTALARFRPRAAFNPYIGGGLGYSFIGFEPTDEFNQLSLNLDRSRGGLGRLTEATYGAASLQAPAEINELSGASVDARDTFEWHIAGGAEYSFKRRWAAFLDLRWTFGSRSLTVNFNGSDYIGSPVPQLTDYVGSAAATDVYLGTAQYGGMRIGRYLTDDQGEIVGQEGGLVDGGSLQLRPQENQDPNTDCALQPNLCQTYFDLDQPDGVVDPGWYYVQGGSIDYGGIAAQIGIRFTF